MLNLIKIVEAIHNKFGDNANLIICTDNGYWVIRDRVSGKCLDSGDTLWEIERYLK